MKSEYMSLSNASQEAIARQHFFDDLRILVNTPVLHSDSQAALSIVLNHVQDQRSKHIALRYHCEVYSSSRSKRHDLISSRLIKYVPADE
jgi:hypothetical protein